MKEGQTSIPTSGCQYSGITAKDAALGIMIGVQTVLNELGFKLTVPLKETRMLMIAEEAVEQAVATETATLRAAAALERTERSADLDLDRELAADFESALDPHPHAGSTGGWIDRVKTMKADRDRLSSELAEWKENLGSFNSEGEPKGDLQEAKRLWNELRRDLALAVQENARLTEDVKRAGMWAVSLSLHLHDFKNCVRDFVSGVRPTKWESKEPRVIAFGLEFEEMKDRLAAPEPALPASEPAGARDIR